MSRLRWATITFRTLASRGVGTSLRLSLVSTSGQLLSIHSVTLQAALPCMVGVATAAPLLSVCHFEPMQLNLTKRWPASSWFDTMRWE